MKNLKKGDKIRIKNNSVFQMMNMDMVTGSVFLIYPDGHGIAFKCNETGCMETANFGDGDWEKIPS